MGSLFSFFNRPTPSNAELPSIFPLAITDTAFVEADVEATYTKILTDVLERTSGIPEKNIPALWDNCVQSESSEGLVTLLVKAMTKKADLYIVYTPLTGVLRKATPQEQAQIQADYKARAESDVGTYVSFKNYARTDMLKLYSALEYCVIASLHKTVNISKAVQLKMSKLRDTVALQDAGVAVEQAKSIAGALSRGSDVLLDAQDEITNASPDISPTEKAIAFLDAKKAYYLNLPISYITGLQTAGISSTGEADMRAIERGLKQFYFSIIKPVVESVFDCETHFKSQDFRQITSALEALKTFELIAEDDLLPRGVMRQILAQLFNVDLEEMEQLLEEERKEAAAERAKAPTPAALPPGGQGNQPPNPPQPTNNPPPRAVNA